MKKTTSKTMTSKLALGRDTLRVLTPSDLTAVNGGWTRSGAPWCNFDKSFGLSCGTGSVVGD